MKTERIDLYKYFNVKRPDGANGYLTTLIMDDYNFCQGRLRPAMLVLAGGGYSFVSQREKEPIALQYAVQGFNTFMLDYSLAPVRFPCSLIESCMAMAYIRENAESLFIDKNHVAAIGFSAGGHLLGSLSTMYNCEEVKVALGEKYSLCRPDAAIFSYAVISSDSAHKGSFQNLCGDDFKLWERVSIEKHVTENSPPAFIWGTVNDGCVPSENSLALACAYKKVGVPFELHLFEDGVHGLSVCSEETFVVNKEAQSWIALSIAWLKNRGFLIKDKGE